MRGLNSKTRDFYNAVHVTSDEYDMIALTETWLSNSVYDGELFSENFSVFKIRNRNDTVRGGGVLLAVKRMFDCTLLELDFNFPEIDLLGIKIKINNYTSIYILIVYIAPNCKVNRREDLFSFLESLEILYQNSFIILGDFNITKLNDHYLNNTRNSNVDMLLNFVDFFDCQQLNRITNFNNHILDLVLTKFTCDVYKSSYGFVEVDQHHPPLNIEVLLTASKQKYLATNSNIDNFNYRKADFAAMYQLFQNAEWGNLDSYKNVDLAVKCFYEKIYGIFDICVPKINNISKRYPAYFNKNIIRNIKNKDKLRIQSKKTNNVQLQNQYTELRAQIKNDIKVAHRQYLDDIQMRINCDSRSFWQYIKNTRGSADIPDRMYLNGVECADGKTMSEKFASYFGSVYERDTPETTIIPEMLYVPEVLCINQVTCEDVCDAIKGLKVNRAIGPDNIPSYIFKGMVGFLAEPLKILFNKSLKENKFPDIWKETKICPIFKTGDKKKIEHYRPISLLSCPAKIFECILYKYIYNSVANKITPYQHGFVNKKSTTTNLCNITQYIAESLDKGYQVDVIYTDYAKAFDKVSHKILLNKLSTEFGFNECLVNFFRSYLQFRKQRVVVKGFYSDYFISTSGVPQGSNLGPLLFLLFINSVVKEIKNCNILMYADDLKIYSRINNVSDSEALQNDLNKLHKWSTENKLSFNINKCYVLQFTRKKNKINFTYRINENILSMVTEMRDLGVTYDLQLNFKTHMANITNKALKMYGFVIRNSKHFNDIGCIRKLYVSYVRSILEYCSIIWSPYYINHSYHIEKVQNKFLRYIYYRKNGIYQLHIPREDVMNTYNLKSLEDRRKATSIIFLYKLIHNLVDDSVLLAHLNFHVPTYRIRNPVSFYVDNTRTNYYSNSPIMVMCKNYDQIRDEIDIFDMSYSRFKNNVNKLI